MVMIPINEDNSESKGAGGADANGGGGAAETSAKDGADGQPETIACDDKGACSVDAGAAADAPCPAGQADAAEGAKAAEYLDMLRRLKAEFDNYKRRVTREKADTISYATEGIINKILPVVDDLQRGIQFMRGANVSADVLKGVELVERQLLDLLADYNVAAFDPCGEPFDPNVHDPLYTMESAEAEDNTVLKVERKGYRMHEKVLRPAQVVVSRKPADAAPAQAGGD